MANPKPRLGNEALWAAYFAAKLRELGMADAASAIVVGPTEGNRLPRGVYEKVPGSGDYWIRYADDKGDIRRQHVGKSLAAARDLAEQRRSEVRLGKFDPSTVGRQKRPQRMTIAEMFTTYLPLRVKVRNNPPHTAEEKALAELRAVIDTLRARNRKLNWELANEALVEKRLEQIWQHFTWMDETLERAAKI